MPRAEGMVEIAAPREVVWDAVADPRLHTELGTVVAEAAGAST
jgi:hypothetical protein